MTLTSWFFLVYQSATSLGWFLNDSNESVIFNEFNINSETSGLIPNLMIPFSHTKYFIFSQSILSKAQWPKLVASTTLISRSGLVCAECYSKIKGTCSGLAVCTQTGQANLLWQSGHGDGMWMSASSVFTHDIKLTSN